MKILSFVLSALGLVSVTASSLVKGERMKQILFLSFCGNLLFAASYLTGGSGINGAASSLLGSLVSIINYFFDIKNRPIPKWVMVIYAATFTMLNLIVGSVSLLSLLLILNSLIFVLCIGQKNGARYRAYLTVSLALLCVYDALSGSYSVLAAHLVQQVFNVVGIFIHDKRHLYKKV